MQRFRGGLVFKAHRLMYLSFLGLRVIKKKKKKSSELHPPFDCCHREPRFAFFWFQVSVFGFQASGFGCSGFGFRVSGFGRVGFRFRFSVSCFRVSCFVFRVSCFVFRVPGFERRVPGFGSRVGLEGFRRTSAGPETSAAMSARSAVCKSQLQHKSVNLWITLVIVKTKLTNLCVS